MVENIKLDELLSYTAHAEYLCKELSRMTREDVAHRGEYQGSIDDLIEDIRDNGIKVPLLVQEDESGERWLRNGHHRLVAAMELGLDEVPVRIDSKVI
jgi:hypothetical protein